MPYTSEALLIDQSSSADLGRNAEQKRSASHISDDQPIAPAAEEIGVILEFIPRGQLVRVSAFDTTRLIEAVIIGPRSARRADLQAAVMHKLRYLQGKPVI
ncbi:MAG: hypothetical protein AAFY56_08945 [Pseudomonadota bacterium]